MNIIKKLTLRQLKENKGRTVVTAMGICVSVAMITAVFVAIASFLNLFGEMDLVSSGNYHAVMSANAAQIKQLREDEQISEIGIIHWGENNSFRLENRKSNSAGTGDFCSGDKVYVRQMVTGDYEGTLPEKIGEIAVEESFIIKNSLDWKIGDTVKIPVGERYIFDGDVIDGYYMNGEKFKVSDTAEYKITALLHDNPATVSRGTNVILLCSADESTALSEDELTDVTVCLKKINHKSLDVIKNIVAQYKITDYSANKSYLEVHFAYDESSELMSTIISMAAVLLAIIIVSSVVLIYNAFAMSIDERVRYLGMLASVGATKKQKKNSVFYESFILGIMGIPSGIIFGIIGIAVTLKIVGGRIIETGMIEGITSDSMTMKTVMPVWAIIGIILVSVLTIFISAVIPSRKASRITPIDAIKQTGEIKVKAKKLRSSKLVRLIFGYEGELANKNLKRNGRKANVITASIALSVILFLSCNYFCSLFTSSINIERSMPYQVQCNTNDPDTVKKALDEMSDVKDYYIINNTVACIPSNMAKEFDISKSENLSRTYKKLFSSDVMLYLNIIGDEMFNDLCKANNIDSAAYYGDEYKVLLMNNVSHRNDGAEVFTEDVIGSNLEGLYYEETDDHTMTVAALIDYDKNIKPCNFNPKNSVSLYMPLSQYLEMEDFNKVHTDDDGFSYLREFFYYIGVETDKHADVTQALFDIEFGENSEAQLYAQDYVEEIQTMSAISFVVQVLVYGFIALISLITIFNIINTISTGVTMRKKEFAMLKSVGTTPSGFNKMIMLESAFYAIKALLFALPISLALSLLMYKLGSSNVVPFEIDYMLYLAVIAVVFVIIGLTMLYSVKKLKNDSIVETLKEEIN